MAIGELDTLRLKDDLPAVVKGDVEAPGGLDHSIGHPNCIRVSIEQWQEIFVERA